MTRAELTAHETAALRTLLRYAIVMTVVGLLAGIAFQESARKYGYDVAPAGLHLEGVLPLGLVHGHVFLLGVLMPLAAAGMLLIARRIGARPVGPRATAWFVRGYLPFAAATVALQLVKAYHVLLALRHGATDLAAVDASLLGGSHLLRTVLYGFVHAGMGVTLCVFLAALWRSLSGSADAAG